MKLLLDTHVALWAFVEPERLTDAVRAAISDRANIVFLSAASTWEVAIKYASGKLALPAPPESLIEYHATKSGLTLLPIEAAHTLAAGRLPQHHRDPFDRMLIAQAIVENLVFVTVDPKIAAYDVPLFD